MCRLAREEAFPDVLAATSSPRAEVRAEAAGGVWRFRKAKAIPKPKGPAICTEIIDRERQATTGIGNGVGIPHSRSAHARKLTVAIGRIPGGIRYGAVDGERVRVIILLVSPKDKTDEHLAAMKSIVKIVRDPYQCKRLLGCSTPESFVDLLTELGGS